MESLAIIALLGVLFVAFCFSNPRRMPQLKPTAIDPAYEALQARFMASIEPDHPAQNVGPSKPLRDARGHFVKRAK